MVLVNFGLFLEPIPRLPKIFKKNPLNYICREIKLTKNNCYLKLSLPCSFIFSFQTNIKGKILVYQKSVQVLSLIIMEPGSGLVFLLFLFYKPSNVSVRGDFHSTHWYRKQSFTTETQPQQLCQLLSLKTINNRPILAYILKPLPQSCTCCGFSL